jgi:hypothetical protein
MPENNPENIYFPVSSKGKKSIKNQKKTCIFRAVLTIFVCVDKQGFKFSKQLIEDNNWIYA